MNRDRLAIVAGVAASSLLMSPHHNPILIQSPTDLARDMIHAAFEPPPKRQIILGGRKPIHREADPTKKAARKAQRKARRRSR
ncbi:hypothetical protein IB276_33065 [Ensifer sp. ENS04]|uniref:hypothetical protein n=1 Tax=Ensifer sp. ENS04 TaxID=2769281 RepID=UPI00177E618D|nr:hypothetical protein [Ensifer sp. ENS04]MBD9544278.1 hypothetical protein [Ensifer sp. ENS04]